MTLSDGFYHRAMSVIPSNPEQDHPPNWALQWLAGPVTSGAFATAGRWEEAWHLDPASLPSPDAVREYVLSCGGELAFEVFSGAAFFGLRMSGVSVQELSDFAALAVECLHNRSAVSQIVLDMASLGLVDAFGRPDFFEIGAVFAWKSVGAFRLEAGEQTLSSWDRWWPAFESTSLFDECRYPKAVEFGFSSRVPHWCGVPIAAAGESPANIAPRLNATLVTAAELFGWSCVYD